MIFGIGMPKTGTRAVAKALKKNGFSVLHNYKKTRRKVRKSGLNETPLYYRDTENSMIEDDKHADVNVLTEGLEKYDAVFDGPQIYYFDLLHYKFPEAKFLFTDRPIGTWFVSMCNHLYRKRKQMTSDMVLQFLALHKVLRESVIRYFMDFSENRFMILNVFEDDKPMNKLLWFAGYLNNDQSFPTEGRTFSKDKIFGTVEDIKSHFPSIENEIDGYINILEKLKIAMEKRHEIKEDFHNEFF